MNYCLLLQYLCAPYRQSTKAHYLVYIVFFFMKMCNLMVSNYFSFISFSYITWQNMVVWKPCFRQSFRVTACQMRMACQMRNVYDECVFGSDIIINFDENKPHQAIKMRFTKSVIGNWIQTFKNISLHLPRSDTRLNSTGDEFPRTSVDKSAGKTSIQVL